ncbi:MAG: tetratricopeptide repeat protein [Selenomonadaceae bacterium]|nr:tetratricopeptide repeat protein [Selenomonadaceae bacterium]
MKKLFATLLIVAALLTASLVGATVKMYTATAEDYASEVESQDIAKLRARDKAIKKATKEAGVYLKTYSRSVNNELTDDEVTAITSNSWQLVGEPKYSRSVKQVSDETSIIVWTATVEVNVDDAELQSWLKRDDKDKSTIITQTREAQTATDENERAIEDLRERYTQAASQTERDEVRQQIDDADRDFLANQKLDEGNRLYYAQDYNGAIRLYGEAVELKPDFAAAYNNRGIAYDDLKQYERAIADYDAAIELDPNFAAAYNNRGAAYADMEQHEQAIDDYDTAIELDPNYFEAYNNRGVAYYNLGELELAIVDYSKAIEINPNNAVVYLNRGVAYVMSENLQRAFADADKAIQLNPNLAYAYYIRGLCLEEFGDADKAQADYARAKELGYDG